MGETSGEPTTVTIGGEGVGREASIGKSGDGSGGKKKKAKGKKKKSKQ